MDNKRTRQLFEAYSEKLLGFINKRVNNKADAEDILQDAFLKIHARIGTLKDDTKIQSWVYRITQNTIIDHYRNQNNSNKQPDSLKDLKSETHEASRQEIADCFIPLINNLPQLYSNVLFLSEIEERNQKDIAEKEGLTLSATKSRIQRGRKILKDTLLQCCHFEFDHQGTVLGFKNNQSDCQDCCK